MNDPFTASLFLALGTCLLLMLIRKFRNIMQLLKGPWGTPIYGYIPFMKSDQHLQFLELPKKYVSVSSIRLGKHDFMVLNDWPSIDEAGSMDEPLARPHEGFAENIFEKMDFTEMSGEQWRKHRTLALHLIRDGGFGRE